jgi:hypothetical protein
MQWVSFTDAPSSSSTDTRAIITEIETTKGASSAPTQAKLAVNTCRSDRQVAPIVSRAILPTGIGLGQ